jgi:hypothetical protein
MLCTLLYKSPKQEVITEYIIHGIAENAFDVGEKRSEYKVAFCNEIQALQAQQY